MQSKTDLTVSVRPPRGGQAISSPLLFMCLKLYGDDELVAHLRAARTWPGASAQSGLHKGLKSPLTDLWSHFRPTRFPMSLVQLQGSMEGTSHLALGRMWNQDGRCTPGRYIYEEVTQVSLASRRRRKRAVDMSVCSRTNLLLPRYSSRAGAMAPGWSHVPSLHWVCAVPDEKSFFLRGRGLFSVR